MTDGNALQKLVNDRLTELDIGARRAAERSGGRVAYESVRLIQRGRHGGKISPRVAEGLSIALQVPIERIWEAAESLPPLGEWILPEFAHKTTQPQRRAVEAVIAQLVATRTE